MHFWGFGVSGLCRGTGRLQFVFQGTQTININNFSGLSLKRVRLKVVYALPSSGEKVGRF